MRPLTCIANGGARARDRSNTPPLPTRWRELRELRVVLYWLAVYLLLQLPIGVLKAHRAVNDPNLPSWETSPWSVYPTMGWIGRPIGVAILLYDRRRLRREFREDRGACEVCGYDLRATPQRCPECGAPAATAS